MKLRKKTRRYQGFSINPDGKVNPSCVNSYRNVLNGPTVKNHFSEARGAVPYICEVRPHEYGKNIYEETIAMRDIQQKWAGKKCKYSEIKLTVGLDFIINDTYSTITRFLDGSIRAQNAMSRQQHNWEDEDLVEVISYHGKSLTKDYRKVYAPHMWKFNGEFNGGLMGVNDLVEISEEAEKLFDKSGYYPFEKWTAIANQVTEEFMKLTKV